MGSATRMLRSSRTTDLYTYGAEVQTTGAAGVGDGKMGSDRKGRVPPI